MIGDQEASEAQAGVRRPDAASPPAGPARVLRPRVVIFDAYPHVFAGAQHIDRLLARELPDQGWPVLIVVPGAGRFVEVLEREKLPVEVVQAPPSLSNFGGSTRGRRRVAAAASLPGYWLRLARRLRELQPSVVHIADVRGMVLAGVPGRLAGARVVWHVHGVPGGRGVNRFAACLAHAIVVPSRWEARQVGQVWPHRPIEVIVNAVSDQVRRSRPVDPIRAPVVVVLGRLHPHKGIDVLLRAASLLAPAHTGLQVLIAGADDPGSPAERELLQALADGAGLAGRVHFLGFRDRAEQVIARARIYVQPSRFEPQGLAILEAMAIGVPVVASEVGGVPEVVIDGVNGLLVPPDDPAALAGAIDRLLGDPTLAERLRQAAFQTMSGAQFSPGEMAARTVTLYERILRAD